MSPTYVLRTFPADNMNWSPYGLILPPSDVLRTSLYGSISKAKKPPRDKDFFIWLRASLYGSISKAKKPPRDKDLCIWS